jgi:rhodanese-related sulfurtransferase
MNRRLFFSDAAWTAFIMTLAAALGLLNQWSLVSLSWRGELPAHIEKIHAAQRQVTFKGIETVTLDQALALFNQKQVLIIDARTPEEYAEIHIEGAVNLPAKQFKEQGRGVMKDIAAGRPILVYCGQEACDASLKVARELKSLGYKNVKVFLGGFRAWDDAGYPVGTGL